MDAGPTSEVIKQLDMLADDDVVATVVTAEDDHAMSQAIRDEDVDTLCGHALNVEEADEELDEVGEVEEEAEDLEEADEEAAEDPEEEVQLPCCCACCCACLRMP